MATTVQISVFQNSIANLAEEVDLILNMKDSLTEIFWTISTVHYSLQGLNQSTIHHVLRENNAIVHSLTKKALEFENPVVWMESFLPQIM